MEKQTNNTPIMAIKFSNLETTMKTTNIAEKIRGVATKPTINCERKAV